MHVVVVVVAQSKGRATLKGIIGRVEVIDIVDVGIVTPRPRPSAIEQGRAMIVVESIVDAMHVQCINSTQIYMSLLQQIVQLVLVPVVVIYVSPRQGVILIELVIY